METNDVCSFCANRLEDIDHLSMQCPFVNKSWSIVAHYCPIRINSDFHFLDWADFMGV